MTATDFTMPIADPPQRGPVAGKPHWPHALLLVLGVVLSLSGLALSGVTAALGAAVSRQSDGGFITAPTERYAVDTYAITTQQLDAVIDEGLPTAGRTGPIASFQLRATSATPGRDIFVGVGPQADVARYLDTVEHSELTQIRFNPFRADYRTAPGSEVPTPPAAQNFWAVSAQGPGTQQIVSDLRSGRWAVVIMNADGSRPVAVDLQAGVRSSLLAPVAIATLVVGLLLLAIGIAALVVGASGLGRLTGHIASPTASEPGGGNIVAGATVRRGNAYPAQLSGDLDPQLSRWKWLVKWFLAVPHYVVLSVLWFALVVTTVFSAFAILVTGRYPRSLFDFNVGVLRWSWRVGFYAYAAVGSDRYPPFTLSRTDYPAEFDVDYPEHLSRGLVLVKSWLLAIPHLVILGFLTANAPYWWNTRGEWTSADPSRASISLLGFLVLVAGCCLLVTRHYPRPLFDLIM